MFVQICFLTAGLYLGRRLLDQWKQLTDDEIDEGPQQQLNEAGEAEGKPDGEPRPELAADSRAPHQEGYAQAEEAEGAEGAKAPLVEAQVHAHAQLETALVSAGFVATTSALAPRLTYLTGVGVMYGSIPTFQRAAQLLRSQGRLGIEFLNSVSLIFSIAARNFASSALIFLIDSVAEKLRLQAETTSRKRLLAAFAPQDQSAWLRREVDGHAAELKVPIDSLCPGDVVIVHAGDTIPADGVIIEGKALVNQHAVTGESQPVDRAGGDPVFGTTQVLAGQAAAKVTTVGEKTAAAALAQILRHTADQASDIERQSKEFVDASAAPLLALSALSYPFVGLPGAIALLNLDIVDNLRLIAPVGLLGHLHKAYQCGILLKDARSLPLLSTIDTIVFDNSGPLSLARMEDSARGQAEVAAVLSALRQRNFSLVWLSSTPEEPTRAMAQRLSLYRYFAGVRREDKAAILRGLQQEGRNICFVGDGVNDDIALKQATLSVSLRGTATAATDNAQVVLLDCEPHSARSLRKLPMLFAIADDYKRTMDGIFLSAVVPAVVAAGGVLLAGFTTTAVTALDIASMTAGAAVAGWPYLKTPEKTPGKTPGKTPEKKPAKP